MKRYLIGIPFVLLILLIAPFALLAAPVLFIGCLVLRVDPLETLGTLWRIFAALRGTRVEVAQGDRLVQIHIS
jgi:hypothetical protein